VENRLSTLDEHAHRLPRPAFPASADGDALDQPRSSLTQATHPTHERQTAQPGLSPGKTLLWEVAQTILLTVAIFLSVRLVVQNFRVEGASMDPTLKSGQFLLINKIAYAHTEDTPLDLLMPGKPAGSTHYLFGGPTRGDIIVFRSPGSSDKDFIKRVIGLPGEKVKMQDGRVYINGTLLDEPYITHRATYDLDEKRVPNDSFFVLGDNRPNSSDSHLGWFVTADRIIGRAWVSYWPPGLWGVIPSTGYANLER